MQYLRDGDLASNNPTTGTRSITAASASQPRRNVYFYLCKDDGTAKDDSAAKDDGTPKQALNAFRSLLSQLFKDHNHLCRRFNSVVREQEECGYRPTSDPKLLKDLLIELVAMLQQPTFLIIDALDECLMRDRAILLDFLEQVCDQITYTRVLTSARASQSDLSEKLFPEKVKLICSWDEARDLPERDRYIAEFLVKQHMNQVLVSKDVRQLLVNKLTSRMQGSAIWARMTLEHIVTTAELTSPDSIRFYLKENELPKPLTQLYLRVFENMTGGKDGKVTWKWLLARSLQLIAGARRHLTFDELLYALSLYTPPLTRGVSHARNLAKLRDILHSQVVGTRIRRLLRPFADLEPTVGFVHRSLKDAVLEFAPLTNAAPSMAGGGIGGVMLTTCVDYLLLDDFNWKETIPNDKGVLGEVSPAHEKMLEDHRKMLEDHEEILEDD